MKPLEHCANNGPASRVICGTAHLCDADSHRKYLDCVYDEGCRIYDTARVYSNGDAERSLGKWIRERRNRDSITIITKCGHPSQRSRLTRADLVKDLEQSLDCLGIDCIDLLLLHKDDLSVSVGALIDVLNEFAHKGKIATFGVSNWSVKRIEEALKYSEVNKLEGLCASSVHFSLAAWNRVPWVGCRTVAGTESIAERRWYTQTQFPLLAWSPLAGGFLAAPPPERDQSGTTLQISTLTAAVYMSRSNLARRSRALELSRAKGVTLAQLSIAYVLSQPMNVSAIIGASTGSHFTESWLGATLRLSESELLWLES